MPPTGKMIDWVLAAEDGIKIYDIFSRCQRGKMISSMAFAE
jgi:hypothetical protein